MLPWWFFLILLLISIAYSMVGHGGASGYVALMVLADLDQSYIRPAALILNVIVASIAFISFQQAGKFKPSMFLVFAAGSVPAAYLGGSLELPSEYFKLVLGILLLFAAAHQLGVLKMVKNSPSISYNKTAAILLGAFIGLISGLIGVGGGILLSPVLLFLKWTDQRETAAISAPFIVINSLAGLAGLMRKDIEMTADIGWLVPVVLAGALTGSLLGARKLPDTSLSRVLSLVMCIAAFKLIFQ